jgi:hypothetical protein
MLAPSVPPIARRRSPWQVRGGHGGLVDRVQERAWTCALRRARELLQRSEVLRLMSADLAKQSARATERASIALARTVKATRRR